MEKKAKPRQQRKLRRRIITGLAGTGLAYTILILVFFQTPKASYWLDDPIYGNTKYFHFKSGAIHWNQSLPVAPPQTTTNSFRLAIVELDEYGDFYQSETDHSRPEGYQLECAKQMLRHAAAADGKPVLLFLLIHGWQHNASREDETLLAFKQLLGCLAENTWMARDFSICGIYIGWRGASIQHHWFTLPAELVSFWPRKSVAEKVASTSASSAIFGIIDTARKTASNPTTTPARIVLAGHSLGAGILMNSLSQAMAYQYALGNSGQAHAHSTVMLDSPANLILLLNPAVESVYLRQLRESMSHVDTNAYPWLVSLTSETDWVTKYLFPFAHTWRFSSVARQPPYFEEDWRHYQPGSSTNTPLSCERTQVPQAVYATKTPGHNPYMQDLRLVVEQYGRKQAQALRQEYPHLDPISYNMQYGKLGDFLLRGEGESLWYGYFDDARPKARIHPLFWVATVDHRIMDGHGLPFDDSARRDNFVATIVTLMNDSGVQFPVAVAKAQLQSQTLK